MTLARLSGVLLAGLVALAACSGNTGSDDQAATGDEQTAATAEPAIGAEGDGAAPDTDDSAAVPAEAVQVEIPTADGETLTANYTAVDGGPGVVLGHMRGTGKETWDAFAKAAADAGFAVLALDSRGYGGSTGDRDTDLDIDLAAGVDFLLEQGAPTVAVIGASMNGTATVVAGSQLDLAGIATLSAPGEFAGLDAVSAAPSVNEPSLIIAAEDDEPYASTAPELADGAGGELVLFPGDAHGTNLFLDHGPALTDLLLGFLTEVTG